MVSYLFYYQLALLASIWLFVMLRLIWPKRGVPTTTASGMLVVKPQRQGIKEPKPFDGPTKKPHCTLREHDIAHPQPPAPVPPDPMPPTHRRPRAIDTSQHFCPHYRVVFDSPLAIEQVLAACGWTSNTAFVEWFNPDIRQRVAAIGHRVNTLGRDEDRLLDQLVLFQVYHNFVLPHASLRQPRLIPAVTNGTGSARMWRPCTPAMAAGLTNHVWSLKEVLCSLVPPWPQPQAR
jgi:hypothetical protein